MTPNIFVISDTHFCHANILTFKDKNDKLIREGFRDIGHMDEVIIDNWNRIVKPQDKVYHLGDVVFGKSNIKRILPRLLGKKRLVLGNHDYEAKSYYPHFQKVMSWRQFGEFRKFIVMTHFPLHTSAFDYRAKGKPAINIHGHLHEKEIPDTKHHVSVCVEKTGYKPVSIEDIIDGKFGGL